MKKIFSNIVFVLAMFAVVINLSSCHSASPDADEEAVLIKKPWFFGHGGVEKEPVTSGLTWCVWSTSKEYVKITPQRYDEAFDDIFSNDNTPLDFNTYMNLQVMAGHSPELIENYGVDWYKNNVQVFYRNKTREYVSMYSPFDLISNREVLNKIDAMLMKDMQKHFEQLNEKKPFPVKVISVTTGAARPNKDQLTEMNKTAAAIQAAKTQQRNREMEEARAAAENARAIADKAYMNAMSLNAEQFIQLKYIEMIASKKDANIDVLIGSGASSMWNVRR